MCTRRYMTLVQCRGVQFIWSDGLDPEQGTSYRMDDPPQAAEKQLFGLTAKTLCSSQTRGLITAAAYTLSPLPLISLASSD